MRWVTREKLQKSTKKTLKFTYNETDNPISPKTPRVIKLIVKKDKKKPWGPDGFLAKSNIHVEDK